MDNIVNVIKSCQLRTCIDLRTRFERQASFNSLQTLHELHWHSTLYLTLHMNASWYEYD